MWTYVEPSSKHPRSVLLNLEPLNIDDGQDETHQYANTDETNPDLHVQTTAEGHVCDHQSTNETHNVQQHRKVTGDAVDDDPLMANERRELHTDEKASGQDTSKVEHDANPVPREGGIVVAFSWCGGVSTYRVGGAKVAVQVEVHETGEGEPKKRAGEDEPEDEVIGFAETDGIVDLAGPGVEAVLWWAGGCCHLGIAEVGVSMICVLIERFARLLCLKVMRLNLVVADDGFLSCHTSSL